MEKIVERFFNYISFDTKSDEKLGQNRKPSTDGQKKLAEILKKELEELGFEAKINDEAFVFATLVSNADKKLPTVGFISHMDTSPEMDGKILDPQIIKYEGGDIKLNDEVYLRVSEFPSLEKMIGKTLITTRGESLLGADDKAGIAEIINAMEYIVNHPEIEHGDIKVAFTPDEEIGTGCDSFDVDGFGADFAYTIDGGAIGELEYESFNASQAEISIRGKSVHPGSSKNTMINSMRVAKELDDLLGDVKRPEHTEGYEGFYHMVSIEGSVEKTELTYIIRDHDRNKFEEMKSFLKSCLDFINNKYGKEIVKMNMYDQYYNMGEILKDKMEIVDYAKTAMEKLDIKPIIEPIRGGTDGSKLSFMGLPCPNIFTGGYNFHGIYEYIPIEDMIMASKVIVEIVKTISEKN
ncbi:MAG: peptidase T [Peptoniphilaceae bacterium]|nr:peptidase T [Peptoniphilaceae bacterium]MDY6019610.1 peptidase T [Anaerococcus sp.]